jgi:Carboxypeptidase regulatory-like domain/TonB dependent receptor
MAYTTFPAKLKNSGGVSRLLCLAAVLAIICFLLISPAAAQFDTGTISGSVTDSSGAVVPRSAVTITNLGTGIKKTLQTDAGGNFTGSALPFGTYVVTADASNFATATSQQIVLNVGSTVHVNLTMNVAAASQSVEVTGTTTTVDTASSTAGTTLNSAQIANLPINGRDVSDFLEIAPGSVGSTGFFQGSVNGLENIFTGLNVTVDGQNATRGDINGFLDTEGQEGARITRSSVDSIQEIDFSNNGYSSEYGHSLGPQMNIITKSGTNAYHGTLFEFLRNDALDARDYFDKTGPQAPLRLNQFGGNLSGPIVPNKLFFFVNYEGDRTKITSINPIYHVLSASARAAFADPNMQDMLNQLAPIPAGCNVIPTPASCEYNNDPNFVIIDAKLPTTVREDTGSARIDYNLSDRDRLMFRYNINDSLTNYTFGLNQGQLSPQKLRTQLGKLDYTRTFTPTLLNEFSLAVDRFYSDTNSNTPLNTRTGTPLVGWSGFFTDLGALPGPNTFNQITPFTTYELFDTVTKTLGSHTLKFGMQDRLNRLNEWLRPQQVYLYGSLADLQGTDPLCTPGTNCPFVLQKIGFPGFLGLNNSNWDFYVQDDWRVTRNLTLNLGLRYDYNTAWSEGHGRMQNFDFATQSFLTAGAPAYDAPAHDFAPRVGLAWDPFGKGKTVIHGYGGLFYMPMQMGFGLTTNIPEFSNYNVDLFTAAFNVPPIPIAYPAPNPPLVPSIQNVTIFPTHPRDPVSTNWLFGIQQEVLKDTVLTVNYMGNKVTHMQAGVSFAAVNLHPSNPNQLAGRTCFGHPAGCPYASENYDPDILYSSYNSLQAQLRSKIGSKLNLEANYTWSHEIDDLVNVFGGWSDPFNINLDRSSGDWDVRHNFTASAVYSLPELKESNGVERAALGGWQLSSIVQARSGLPTNIQLVSGFFGNPMRPDFTGQPLKTASANWPNGNYNPAAFEVPPGWNGIWDDPSTIGTVGRNALRGPGFFQLDFSLMKNFAITERSRIQFRTDLFNILNHPNFANPDGGICTSVDPASHSCTNPFTGLSTVNGNFGQSTATVATLAGGAISNGTARQIQFSLKVIF